MSFLNFYQSQALLPKEAFSTTILKKLPSYIKIPEELKTLPKGGILHPSNTLEHTERKKLLALHREQKQRGMYEKPPVDINRQSQTVRKEINQYKKTPVEMKKNIDIYHFPDVDNYSMTQGVGPATAHIGDNPFTHPYRYGINSQHYDPNGKILSKNVVFNWMHKPENAIDHFKGYERVIESNLLPSKHVGAIFTNTEKLRRNQTKLNKIKNTLEGLGQEKQKDLSKNYSRMKILNKQQSPDAIKWYKRHSGHIETKEDLSNSQNLLSKIKKVTTDKSEQIKKQIGGSYTEIALPQVNKEVGHDFHPKLLFRGYGNNPNGGIVAEGAKHTWTSHSNHVAQRYSAIGHEGGAAYLQTEHPEVKNYYQKYMK